MTRKDILDRLWKIVDVSILGIQDRIEELLELFPDDEELDRFVTRLEQIADLDPEAEEGKERDNEAFVRGLLMKVLNDINNEETP